MTSTQSHVDQARAGHAGVLAKRRRFLIVHNPVAGRNHIALAHQVASHLEQAGAVADLHCLGDGEHQDGALADIGSYDALVASGGDGTMRSLVAMLKGRDTPCGLIPAGTGNVLAEELRLPRGAPEIADMLLHGPVVGLSTGTVNGAPLLLMLGAGFDGEVVAELPLGLKRRIGKLAFGWPIMAALTRKPRRFTATIDGKVHEASWLVISNAARYGGRFLLSERTNVLNPGFNIVISRATTRRERLMELVHLIAGRLERCGTIDMMPARDVEIPDAAAVPIQVDGEPITSPALRIVANAARTPMIVPARHDEAGSL